MKYLQTVLATLTIVITFSVVQPQRANAYQIDCAILLCLAGGFPPSAPCVRARAEMIRRITPWPIEPPLQLWRCPMRAQFLGSKPGYVSQQIDIRFLAIPQVETAAPRSAKPFINAYVEEISQYLSSIKVYHLRYSRHYSSRDDSCVQWGRLDVGFYATDGTFSWRRQPYNKTPVWVFDTQQPDCPSASFRGVGLEWQDYAGKVMREIVKY